MFADSSPSDHFTTDAHASLATTISPQPKGSFQTCHICNTNPAPTTTDQLRAPPLHTESRPGQQATPSIATLADSTPSRPSQNDSVYHPCTPNLIQATERAPTSHSEIQIAKQAIQQLAEASCLQLQSPTGQYRQIQVPSLQLCSVTDHRRTSVCVTFATTTLRRPTKLPMSALPDTQLQIRPQKSRRESVNRDMTRLLAVSFYAANEASPPRAENGTYREA